jgi:hypothetical protein
VFCSPTATVWCSECIVIVKDNLLQRFTVPKYETILVSDVILQGTLADLYNRKRNIFIKKIGTEILEKHKKKNGRHEKTF